MENCFDVISNKDGLIVDVGGEFERIFGFSREEAIGQSLDIIIPENLRERHWQGYRRVFSSGVTKYEGKLMKTKGLKKDGTNVYVYMTIKLIEENGKLTYISANFKEV